MVWGRSWARFDCKNIWFLLNLELVTDATDATEPGGEGEVVSRPATRTPHPTRTGGQDDGSYTNSLKQGFRKMTLVAGKTFPIGAGYHLIFGAFLNMIAIWGNKEHLTCVFPLWFSHDGPKS